ncbi:MAG: ParA family protein [Gammaproteobacteria bacterium]|jgi:chromosome partitioning protein
MLLSLPANPGLRKIVVLNPKGGSGKSTLAVNLAGYLADDGRRVALMDFDPQQSAMQWLGNRSDSRPEIYGIAAHKRDHSVTRSFQYRIPRDIEYLVVDSPAAIPDDRLIEFTHGSHAILVPVMPSAIDTRAASKLIACLLLKAKVSRTMGRLGVVINRARERTIAYRKLKAFLNRLSITAVAVLRDSQNYVRAGEQGISIHEMRPGEVRQDLDAWEPLIRWLESRAATDLTPRDLWPLSAEGFSDLRIDDRKSVSGM